MNHSSAPDRSTEIRALNIQISELENQYAELFLRFGNPELLKCIHLELEALKRKLEKSGTPATPLIYS